MRWPAWAILIIEVCAWLCPPVWLSTPSDRRFIGSLQVDAMTVGPFILQVGPEKDRCMEIHETIHVNQWRDTGILVFYTSYGFYYLKNRIRGMDPEMAYYAIPYEVAARSICDGSMVESLE